MVQLATFHLYEWLEGNKDNTKYVLGGSAAPSISLDDLVALSNNPTATREALNFGSLKLGFGSAQGALGLRNHIANLYSEDILSDHVITTVGTTGANLVAFQSLLHVGDHVICQFPSYTQLLALPKSFPCEVSYWKLDPENGWRLGVEELQRMIKPSTKMIILNNPSNPTGFYFDPITQQQIIDIARQHDIIVFADEIFWPLYHDDGKALSFVEHAYDKVIVTSSMSKVWGTSGARVGWMVCRSRLMLDLFLKSRQYTFASTSVIDEVIATEILSNRCRPTILNRHLEYARKDLELLDAFVEKNSDMCSWTRPKAGAAAFVKFTNANGEPVDDVEFCRQLLEEHGLLLAPGSLAFGDEGRQDDFRGYVRVHFTLTPEYLRKGLELIDAFLDKKRKSS